MALGGAAVAMAPGRALARFVDPGPAALDLRSFGVVADGVTDDAPALGRAFAAAAATGAALALARPGTLLLRATVTVPGALTADLGRATLLKAPDVVGPALLVMGSGVALSGLTVDANRRGGARGAAIEWRGGRGQLVDATLRGSDQAGLVVAVAGADVRCARVASSDHVSGQKSGDGFYAALGGRLALAGGCSGTGNDRAGVYFESSAAAGCVVNGTFDGNAVVGAYLKSPQGRSTSLSAARNDRFGVIMKQAASGWTFGTVTLTGDPRSANVSATGIELYGCTGNTFRSIVARGMTGYGVALAKGDVDAPGASGNTFLSIDSDATGATDSDPAVHLSGGAKRNVFGTVRAVRHTVALSFGEGNLPLDNDGNTFRLVHAEACPYGAAIIRGGSGNRIDRLETVGCGTVDPRIAQGLVVWGPTATQDNSIGVLDVTADASGALAAPLYLVVAEGAARNNRVDGGRRGPVLRAIELDPAGTNPVTLA